MKTWKEDEIADCLKQAAEREEIPKCLEPEQMEKMLKDMEGKGKRKTKNYRKWCGSLGMAACFVFLLFAANHMKSPGTDKDFSGQAAERKETSVKQTEQKEMSKSSYVELYDYFQKRKAQIEQQYQKQYGANKIVKEDIKADGAGMEESSDADTAKNNGSSLENSTDYGQTNRQEENVDEADIVKNDGRYLYQVIYEKDYASAVQIVDTQKGLRETARIRGFDNIDCMYLWKDLLIVLEQGYAEILEDDTTYLEKKENMTCEIGILGNPYVNIKIYNIKDRSNPKEEQSFTIQGSFLDSRISDGYFYCFLERGIDVPENPNDFDEYVPVLRGEKVDESDIYLPKDAQALSYVLMTSIDLKQPGEFKDSKAIVSSGDRVYVTENNIYILDNWWPDVTEKGQYSNRTKIFRFSYQDGILKKEAEGSVKGILLDDMAISESDGYLRLAVTVESYKVKEVFDDILDQMLGFDTSERKMDNSLYVLDERLKVVGKIENLAENEQIYSARFLGDAGYFVTFENTDPLFSVDVSDPRNPVVLGELKISGFSEYLHFYGEDLLLGIGMEADKDTGRTQGMKLSMFDISNPSDVKEQDKFALSEYDYSESLYNYKGVLIDTEKNLFGFSAEGYQGDKEKKDYLLFSYDSENGKFEERMKIPYGDGKQEYSTTVRGTYIGEVFYLMYGDGRIESYSLESGAQREIMKGK